MAKIVLAAGNEGPVNDGERKVLKSLAEQLPDSFELHPNLQLAVGNGDLIECDIVVLGPDCVWIVEVKDLAGKVVVGEHEFWYNGEPRKHPVAQTRLKAQKLKSRLSLLPDLQDVWVQPLVVLAREPSSLEVATTMARYFVRLSHAVQVLADPTLAGLQAGKLPAARKTLVAQRLGVDGSARRARARFGPYRANELLSRGEDREWWLATHEVMGTTALLEVVHIDPVLEPSEQQRRRTEAYRAAKVRARVGPFPYLLTPETAFNADDGSVVVVHPNDPSPSLHELGDEAVAKPDEVKRLIVARIAAAVDVCHARGVVHRTIGPSSIFVPPTGNARLGGFSRASFQGTTSGTVGPSDWGALGTAFWDAPEHTSGKVGPEADLYALGRLIEHLWPDGAPTDLADAAVSLLDPVASARLPAAKQLAVLAVPPPAAAPKPPGAIAVDFLLGGRYLVRERLGSGSSGTVWKADDSLTGKAVALKVYERSDADSELGREYQALEDVVHPGIVRVRSAEQLEGRWVLVSEFLDGPSLRASMPPIVAPLSVDQAASTAMKLLDALRAVHPDMPRIVELADKPDRTDAEEEELERLRAHGITHRDVKPENIIMVQGDRPVLVDFGLAATGSVGAKGGTYHYRPPGIAFDHADPDLDLFAVGVILHELLTGRHPYTDDDPVAGRLAIEPSLPPGIAEVLTRACSPKFEERFHSAQEFIAALVALGVDDVPIALPPPDVTEVMKAIQTAMAERRWDDALELCHPEWAPVRARILVRKELDVAAAEQTPLLEIDDFTLSFVETRPFRLATTPGNVEAGPGTVRVYLVRGPNGEMLEILDHRSDSGERWVGVGDVYETPLPLSRLRQGLRMGLQSTGDGYMAELRQARINDDRGWSNLYQASPEQLDVGAGVCVESTLRDFGVVGFGTRHEVLGEIGPRRNYLCMLLPHGNEHAPAVAHFLTKVMPLAHGVSASE